MATPLTFEYDPEGDILYINKVAPHSRQDSEQVSYNVVVRRNLQDGAVENVEILFFSRWLLEGAAKDCSDLEQLFAGAKAVASA